MYAVPLLLSSFLGDGEGAVGGGDDGGCEVGNRLSGHLVLSPWRLAGMA